MAGERVRMEVETIEGERPIWGQLRNERIELDDSTAGDEPPST